MFRASQTGQQARILQIDFFHYLYQIKHTSVTLGIILYEIYRTFHFFSMFRASSTGPRAGIFELFFFHYFCHVEHTLVTLQIIFYNIGKTFHFYHFHTMFRASLQAHGPQK